MTNNKYKILFIEDEANITTAVSTLLEANGYQAITAKSYAEGKMLYFSHTPDLVLLDLGLPDRDGCTLLYEIRQKDSTPIIILSARGDESEKVKALDMGANDYITKPYGTAELMARIRTALRNHRHMASNEFLLDGKFSLRDMMIDYDRRQVFIGENEIKLTQTEYNILSFLSMHPEKLLTYSSIIRAIWREGVSEGNIKKLQVNMANIRRKLGAKPGEESYIINELGVGYRMNG